MKLALKRLPWYIAFCLVLGPLLLAPFTFGSSLLWYIFYFVKPLEPLTWIPVGVGVFIWLIRLFIVAFSRAWFKDHLQGTETGSIVPGSWR